jgi:histidinol dehydrogenase
MTLEFLKQARVRGERVTDELREAVSGIIRDVRSRGDEAVRSCCEKFDGAARRDPRVSREEIDRARALVSASDMDDIRRAADNIRDFAEAQMRTIGDLPAYSPSPGVTLGHRVIPVRACCCYVPGGSYPLYSSALMLAIPARVAGVPRVAACSPAMRGTTDIHPRTLAAMDIAGVDEIYAVGGAQAIAAFAYGTELIRPVDLIVGPGNAYVAEAKRQCFGRVGIDFVAGPSEVMVIADGSANLEVIACDLLAQCEHDKMASGVLVTIDRAVGEAVIAAVARRLLTLDTAGIAGEAWEAFGEVILADSIGEAISIANARAPEHLELQTADDETLAPDLYNYGSLFIGGYSAEVFGDYASGPNHTLPTDGAARYTGGIWAGTFLKTCTYQRLERSAMDGMSPLAARLARGEGLAAHALAAEIRLGGGE